MAMTSSSDVFIERVDEITRIVPGVTGIADDVLAKGNDKTSHDVGVCTLLKISQSNTLKCNPNKIQFKMKECNLFGMLITQKT